VAGAKRHGGHRSANTSAQIAAARARQAQRSAAVAQRNAAISRSRSTAAANAAARRSLNRTYINNTDSRRYEVNRNYYNPPTVVYRDWDRDRVHYWNNHRYHWYDNAWVVLDVPTVAFGGGSLTANVQAALEREGYDPGPVDGVMGPGTRDAIADYQSDHGLYVTGEINDSLLRSLELE
jgi:hypothetical protein